MTSQQHKQFLHERIPFGSGPHGPEPTYGTFPKPPTLHEGSKPSMKPG